MDIKPIIRLDEVPKTIILPNPGGRELLITPEESGVEEEQVFTSEDLPDEIPYEFLGLVKLPEGCIYPKYKSNVITTKELALNGKIGELNGINIINNIAFGLTYQEDIMVIAKSIKYSDLKSFDYKSEKLRYWLASSGFSRVESRAFFGPGAVLGNDVFRGGIMSSGSNGQYSVGMMAVRPTMVLKVKVQLNSPKIPWVEL